MERSVQRDIVDILISDTQLFHNRRKFYESLNPLDPNFEQLNNQINNGTIQLHEFCTQSLGKWVAHNGSGATVEKLIEIMELNKFQLIADKIKSTIPTTSTSNGNRFFEIDPPTGTFVGRIQELDQLNEFFKNPGTSYVKVIGMGGVGKSELAKSFANSKRSDVNGIWLNAESTQSLSTSITQLANILKVPLTANNQPKPTVHIFTDLISAIRVKNQLKIIILIDNVDKENVNVKGIIEVTNKKFKSQCFPLVTSRYRPVVDGGGEVINLDVLNTKDAHKLITNSLKEEDGVHISTLCNMLHNFPLALQQAVAYIKQRKLSSAKGNKYNIRNYLDAYEDQHAILLDHPLSEIEHEYKKTTLVTWTISMEHIKNTAKSGTLAIKFLNLIAYFEADRIPVTFISRIYGNNGEPKIQKMGKMFTELNFRSYSPHNNKAEEVNATDAVELLKAYSIIKIEDEVISIHRLIQQVTRVNLESSKLEVEILTKFLQSIDDIDDTLTPTDMPHVLSVWKYSTKYKDLIIKFPNLSCKIANKLVDLSLYRELLDFASESYNKLNTVFGETHIETLRMESHVASALRLNGKYSDALEKFEIVLQKKKSHLGEEHEETLATGHDMALTLHNLERYDEATEFYKRVFESSKRVLGETHSSTMSTKHNIALVLSTQGKTEEAMKIYEDVLEWRMAELGEEHPKTLTTKHNIAHCLYDEGEYEKAKTLFQQVLEMELKVLGEEHSHTLDSKYMLGWTLHKMGESEKGLKMLKEVLISREKVLGPEHPHTILTRNQIDLIIKETQGINQ